jgi:hypothetical protein
LWVVGDNRPFLEATWLASASCFGGGFAPHDYQDKEFQLKKVNNQHAI